MMQDIRSPAVWQVCRETKNLMSFYGLKPYTYIREYIVPTVGKRVVSHQVMQALLSKDYVIKQQLPIYKNRNGKMVKLTKINFDLWVAMDKVLPQLKADLVNKNKKRFDRRNFSPDHPTLREEQPKPKPVITYIE